MKVADVKFEAVKSPPSVTPVMVDPVKVDPERSPPGFTSPRVTPLKSDPDKSANRMVPNALPMNFDPRAIHVPFETAVVQKPAVPEKSLPEKSDCSPQKMSCAPPKVARSARTPFHAPEAKTRLLKLAPSATRHSPAATGVLQREFENQMASPPTGGLGTGSVMARFALSMLVGPLPESPIFASKSVASSRVAWLRLALRRSAPSRLAPVRSAR